VSGIQFAASRGAALARSDDGWPIQSRTLRLSGVTMQQATWCLVRRIRAVFFRANLLLLHIVPKLPEIHTSPPGA
jgi:hypothetical protein